VLIPRGRAPGFGDDDTKGLIFRGINKPNVVTQALRVEERMVLGVMLAAVLAQAATEAAPAAATDAAKAEKPKKVCVEEAQMGSHFKRKICATPEEWEKRRERDAAVLDKRGANTPTK
jgi:hypothetical protein